jgi:hypothetical protein
MFLVFHDSIFAHPTFSSSTNNFAHAQTLSRMSSLSGHMNIARVNIEFFTGCKKIKQRRISFVLGYLRMILWKISTAISIKHRILATFNIKNKFNSDSLYAFKCIVLKVKEEWHTLNWYENIHIYVFFTCCFTAALNASWSFIAFMPFGRVHSLNFLN